MKTKKVLIHKHLGRMRNLKQFLDGQGFITDLVIVNQKGWIPVKYCELFVNGNGITGFVRSYSRAHPVYCIDMDTHKPILYADPVENYMKAKRCSIKADISKRTNEEILGYLQFAVTEQGKEISVELDGVIVNDC